jgi:hypothetical protein
MDFWYRMLPVVFSANSTNSPSGIGLLRAKLDFMSRILLASLQIARIWYVSSCSFRSSKRIVNSAVRAIFYLVIVCTTN